jgi:hypothetical protein
VTVRNEALQLGPVEAVGSKGGALETISDVRQISDPSQVNRNGIEGHEESRKEKEGHGHDWSQKHAILKKQEIDFCIFYIKSDQLLTEAIKRRVYTSKLSQCFYFPLKKKTDQQEICGTLAVTKEFDK